MATLYVLGTSISRLPQAQYPGWANLPGTRYDLNLVRRMIKRVRKNGANVVVYGKLKRNMTSVAFFEHMQTLSDNARDGDVVLVYFSGHGSQIPNHNADMEKYDNVLCFPDGLVWDDEFRLWWPRFHPGVRVVQMIDSCFSGTIIA